MEEQAELHNLSDFSIPEEPPACVKRERDFAEDRVVWAEPKDEVANEPAVKKRRREEEPEEKKEEVVLSAEDTHVAHWNSCIEDLITFLQRRVPDNLLDDLHLNIEVWFECSPLLQDFPKAVAKKLNSSFGRSAIWLLGPLGVLENICSRMNIDIKTDFFDRSCDRPDLDTPEKREDQRKRELTDYSAQFHELMRLAPLLPEKYYL